MIAALRPRLFLSYSRADAAAAGSLRASLEQRGFAVFQDSAEILGGEDFVERIVVSLRRSDAVISLQTPASAASQWCQAELYQAHALGRRVIPVQLAGEEVVLSRPLELLQRRVHRITVDGQAALDQLPADLERQLTRARTRRWKRIATGAAIALLTTGALVSLALYAVGRLNAREQTRQRSAAFARVQRSTDVLPNGQLENLVTRFDGDDDFLRDVLLLRDDPTASDAARMNGLLLAAAFAQRRGARGRWFVRDLDLHSLRLRNVSWTNLTLLGGSLQDVHFEKSTFAGVVFGRGSKLSSVQCNDCDFWFIDTAGATGVGFELTNSSFRGTNLDLTNLSLFRLLSRVARPELQTVITDEVAVMENSVVVNRNQPPAPGVLDLSVPEEEALFDGVVFRNVHFRGYVRPQWFHNCHFLQCVLPPSVTEAALLEGSNTLEGATFADEPLD